MKLTNDKLVFEVKDKVTKAEALNLISQKLAEQFGTDQKKVKAALDKREKQVSTGFEHGLAIPHAAIDGITEPKIVVTKWSKDIEWGSLDNKPTNLSVAIFVPKDASEDHLVILGKISTLLQGKKEIEKFRSLTNAGIAKQINSLKIETKKVVSGPYDIVAVTSCPTGIAHTFMAAEILEKEAKENGMSIKVEKQGQTVVDELSQEEINNAAHIVFATGRGVEESRFAGRSIVRMHVTEPIKDSKKAFQKILDDEGTVAGSSNVVSSDGIGLAKNMAASMDFNNFGPRCWNGILAGVSYMLPFVVTGGILMAMSFLLDMSNAGTDVYGNGTELASWVNQFSGLAFNLMVPILTAFMMYTILGRQGIMVGMVIGLISAGYGPDWIDVFGYNGWMPESIEDGASAASGFIGGISGAIIGCAFIIMFDKLFDKILPKSLHGAKLLLILPFFSTLVGAGLFWFINIPLTFIQWGLTAFIALFATPKLIWVYGIFAGILVCMDLGGPFSKVPYLFGVSTIAGAPAEYGSIYMASTSAACILPPIGCALATCFGRKELWDDADVSAGITGWVLGSTHITEGAIPFATKYPKDIYIQTMICGCIAATLSGVMGICTMAPHGGLLTMALLKCKYFTDVTMQITFGIIIYLSIIAGCAILQAFLIVISRKRTVRKQKEAEELERQGKAVIA